jgi:2-polyprenyl-6-methoxyphenol hydroxylase-like FAD-dependent oxidoreductase
MRGKAVVVGAGPAGLSAAIALARAGMGVTLLEQRSNWPGRVCGGFLNPEGVGHLRTLGAFDAVVAAGAVEVASSRLTTSGGMDRAVSVTVGGTMGLGVPRRVLEETLLDVARELSVTVRMGVRAVAVRRADGAWAVVARRGSAVEHHLSDLAVLADGRFSLAATLALKRRQGWFGWNATFGDVPQRPGELSMHFFPLGYFGVLTFADGSTNVCGLTHIAYNDRRTWGERWQGVLQAQPHLARLVAGATRISDWQGVGPLPFAPAMRPSDGPVLAGDAAAVGDPYMGEGISRALGTGPILQRVLEANTEAPLDAAAVRAAYDRLWARHYASRLRLGTVVRLLQRRPRLFQGALRLVTRRPGLSRAVTRVFHSSSGGREAHSSMWRYER